VARHRRLGTKPKGRCVAVCGDTTAEVVATRRRLTITLERDDEERVHQIVMTGPRDGDLQAIAGRFAAAAALGFQQIRPWPTDEQVDEWAASGMFGPIAAGSN